MQLLYICCYTYVIHLCIIIYTSCIYVSLISLLYTLQVNFACQMLHDVLRVITQQAPNAYQDSFRLMRELCQQPVFSKLEPSSYPSEEVVGHRAFRAFKYFMRAVWAGYNCTLRENYLRTVEYAVHANLEVVLLGMGTLLACDLQISGATSGDRNSRVFPVGVDTTNPSAQ